jgi:hypothetical protein
MKKLYLNTGEFDTIFNDLKDSFSGDLTTTNNDYNLAIRSKWAKGKITGTHFEKEISYMHFDLTFHSDVSLSVESFQSAPIFFAYCEEGSLTHSFGANGEKKNLKKQQTGILNNTSAINTVLYFESFKRIQFSLIIMPITVSVKDESFEVISQLKRTFTNESGSYIYIGQQNPKITQKLKELKTIVQKGTVRSLLQKSIMSSILELEIAQHSYNYATMIAPFMHLATKQIGELKRISHLNFSEVLNSIGFGGKSYIPKLLKERYHVLNKDYPQNSLAKTA